MIRAPLFAIFATLGVAFAPVALAQETAQRADLAWKLEAGQELYYGYTWNLQQTQEIPNVLPPTPSLYQITYTLTEKVTAVDGGVAAIEASSPDS